METVNEAQYRALKEVAGVRHSVDRSFIAVGGHDAAEFLQGQVTNDIEALSRGEGCYAALLNHKGKLQADMRIQRRDSDFLVDIEPSAFRAVLDHMNRFKIGHSVEIEDLSDVLELVTVKGPESSEVMVCALCEEVELPVVEHSHLLGMIAGCDLRVVATANGATGFDLIMDSGNSEWVSTRLMECGAVPIESEAAECMRIESGTPRYGIDMTGDNFPAEAGIETRSVSFEKGCYVGQEPVARMHYRGHPNRRLMGLMCDTPFEAEALLTHNDKEIGTVGSTCVHPRLGPIALAIVRCEIEQGNEVQLSPSSKRVRVVELPFHTETGS